MNASYRLRVDPRVPEAAFGHAMALVALGRYMEALQRLEQGAQSYPGEVDFAYALARVLATAPDASIRDGRRALAVMEALTDEQLRKDGGETMAMALAEVGRYDAVAWQRSAITAAERANQPDVAMRMTENLKLYEKGRPCRASSKNSELRSC
jgi:thioredoxin-like negative regulator of GroEL